MLTIEKMESYGWEAAIRGMRNPLNSWNRADSYWDGKSFVLGPNDFDLARRLIKAGSDHRKFLRQITVGMDITAPLYWWKEMDTYKIGTVADSCSTMHKLTAKPFEMGDFSYEMMNDFAFKSMQKTVDDLNTLRTEFLDENDEVIKRELWYSIIQMLPSSYNQKRTWTANYEVLRKIYNSRHNHKLNEWHSFCDGIAELPYASFFIRGDI